VQAIDADGRKRASKNESHPKQRKKKRIPAQPQESIFQRREDSICIFRQKILASQRVKFQFSSSKPTRGKVANWLNIASNAKFDVLAKLRFFLTIRRKMYASKVYFINKKFY